MIQINVYSLEWKYLGCYWSGGIHPIPGLEKVGDYKREPKFTGPILTSHYDQLDSIAPIEVFLKRMN